MTKLENILQPAKQISTHLDSLKAQRFLSKRREKSAYGWLVYTSAHDRVWLFRFLLASCFVSVKSTSSVTEHRRGRVSRAET